MAGKKGVPRDWDADPELDPQTIGPIAVPWDMRKWIFSPRNGKFNTVVQKLVLDRKTKTIQDQGFRDKHITGASGRYYHSSGSPVYTKAQVEKVFDLADTDDIALNEALLKYHAQNKQALHPDFEGELKEGLKQYTVPTLTRRGEEIAAVERVEEIARLNAQVARLNAAQDEITKKNAKKRPVPV